VHGYIIETISCDVFAYGELIQEALYGRHSFIKYYKSDMILVARLSDYYSIPCLFVFCYLIFAEFAEMCFVCMNAAAILWLSIMAFTKKCFAI